MWRVMEIHKIIRAGRFPNCTTLAAEIEVSSKTVQRDINFMRDQLGLPLEYRVIQHGYFHTQEVHVRFEGYAEHMVAERQWRSTQAILRSRKLHVFPKWCSGRDSNP